MGTEVAVFTRHGVEEKIRRFALENARKRKRKMLTVMTKSKAQQSRMVLKDEIAEEVAKGFEDMR